MIPVMQKSLLNRSARAIYVSWSASLSSSCSLCGGTPNWQKEVKVRKPMQILGASYLVPKLSSSQQSLSVSSSCAVRSGAVAVAAKESGVKWDLYAGIVVERKPIITAELDDFQKKYVNFLAQIEYEASKKSDHEIRIENDLKMMEKVKAGEIDLGNVQTATDDEDKWNTEAQSFHPASRETDADRKNDIRSLERALDSHLLLVVEQKLGQDYRWICPHSKLEQGETLRQAADRMLRNTFPDMKAKVLGHAPWGFYKYKYPQNTKTASTGAKVFFYKAQIVSGEANNVNEIIKDFVWLKRDELSSKLQPEYLKRLSECLIDD